LAREKLLFERKSFGFRLDAELVKQLKIIAVNQDKAVNVLLEEAIELLLKKYND
jgi:predicted transcriptional regulator